MKAHWRYPLTLLAVLFNSASGLAQHAEHTAPTHPPMAHGTNAHDASAPAARDPDYSGGLRRSHLGGMAMADDEPFGHLVFEKFEVFESSDALATRVDAAASYGSDVHRVVLKADVEVEDGSLEPGRVELLWNRVSGRFWNTQAGIRQDVGGDGSRRAWMALGVGGIAPYWFDIEATGYLADGGRIALRAEVDYDLRLGQRLVLSPSLELIAFGQSDPERRAGSGLSDLEMGLRLRYEVSRKFAPYLGLAFHRRLGRTEEFARADGSSVSETQAVAGLRFWF